MVLISFQVDEEQEQCGPRKSQRKLLIITYGGIYHEKKWSFCRSDNACSVVMMAGGAQAINVAGYDFDDNAFADTLISSSGSYTTSGGSLEDVITGSNLDEYAFSWSPGAYVELGFEDNFLANGIGNDLALFELGIPDSFGVSLTIGGVTNTYGTFDTGYTAAGFNVNVALIDLDDFGVVAGSLLDSIVLDMSIIGSSNTVPSLAAVGALNSTSIGTVPEPGTMFLLGSGLLGLIALKRKRR